MKTFSLFLQRITAKCREVSKLYFLAKQLPQYTNSLYLLQKKIFQGRTIVNHNNFAQNRNTLPGSLNSNGQIDQAKEVFTEILKPINRRASLKCFSPSHEQTQIKPRVLPKLEKVQSKGKKERSPQFEEINSKQQDLQVTNVVQMTNTKESISKQAAKTVKNPIQNQIKQKLSTQKSHQEKPNKFINKLLLINGKNKNEINLEREQIQMMYQSFDNGRLASTLINIDIEEISYCVGIQIQKMMVLADLDQIKNINKYAIQQVDNVSSLSDSQNIINDENNGDYIQDQDFQMEQVDTEKQHINKESLYQEEDQEQDYLEEFENNEQQNCNPESEYLDEQFQAYDENK